jgi:hypothetical protein
MHRKLGTDIEGTTKGRVWAQETRLSLVKDRKIR